MNKSIGILTVCAAGLLTQIAAAQQSKPATNLPPMGSGSPPSVSTAALSTLSVEIIPDKAPSPAGMITGKRYYYQFNGVGTVYMCTVSGGDRGLGCRSAPSDFQVLAASDGAAGQVHDAPPTSATAAWGKLYLYRLNGQVNRCVPTNGKLYCVAPKS